MKDLELQKQVGKKIREIRKQRKISQMDLAYSIGMSMNTISYIELGKIASKIDTLNKIANVLNVSVFDFFNFFDFELKTNNKNIVINSILLKLKKCSYEDLIKYEQIINVLIK